MSNNICHWVTVVAHCDSAPRWGQRAQRGVQRWYAVRQIENLVACGLVTPEEVFSLYADSVDYLASLTPREQEQFAERSRQVMRSFTSSRSS